MAQVTTSVDQELSELIQIDGAGWNIHLFEDITNIQTYKCKHCNNVCKDPLH